jgi:hypothetical protein
MSQQRWLLQGDCANMHCVSATAKPCNQCSVATPAKPLREALLQPLLTLLLLLLIIASFVFVLHFHPAGILIGIGESRRERLLALHQLRLLQQRYGHIMEIIIQNFRCEVVPFTLLHLVFALHAGAALFGCIMEVIIEEHRCVTTTTITA